MCLIALGKKRFSKFAENGAFILFPSAPSATVWGGGKGEFNSTHEGWPRRLSLDERNAKLVVTESVLQMWGSPKYFPGHPPWDVGLTVPLTLGSILDRFGEGGAAVSLPY